MRDPTSLSRGGCSMMAERPCRLILLGMMGSGKTTLGHVLATRTGWPYHDNDRLLTATAGRTARELLDEGPDALRRAEAQALREGLALRPPVIVGAAAGVIEDPQARALIGVAGMVVWLRADPRTLVRRAMGGQHRPRLEKDPEGWMRRTAAQREPLYRSIADLAVDTGGTDSDATASGVVDWLRATPCGRRLG